ncbi:MULTISPECIES: chemotaxis response regulator protein-glutamate methylesterase [Nostocales]|uniref:Protein-glutamate methylesterase/protein-glutamine glutaminase n=3 Tax=Nostocales TaxID=1161 RepID=A0A0C1NEE0_9CYAN|nr:chemotaxis response regulator protein-glutamate methylesterase [Tolypothrix bouteillei]KAF3887208.1 chemotaxis response regulator protein-glutamate methylesterase [Tolypothrix bouteillei VB521301]
MRIAIVNDAPIAVEALRQAIAMKPDYEIAWVAFDGVEAVTKCSVDTPDLILMDVLMPEMDGVEATRRIMSQSPCAILMVTASVNRYAAKVFEAMGYGALDAINTPTISYGQQTIDGTGLLKKIATISRLIGKSSYHHLQSSQHNKLLIAIGASTGGPQALATILSQFPKDFQAAFIVIQHIDAQFAPGLAAWLDAQIPMTVQLAIPGSTPHKGIVLIAGKNHHLIVRPDMTLAYDRQPLDSFYHPSVDVFFKSVANHWIGHGVGVLLTGMGRDGAQGLKLLRDKGWHTIAQDRQTSIVYGMPKAAVDLGAAVEVLPVDAIANACIRHLQNQNEG